MRITLDLDDTKVEVIKGKAVLLKVAFPICRVRYRVSSSGDGGHVEVFGADINEDLMYNIRRLFGDHEKRTSIDVSRGKNGHCLLPKQVLFSYKIKEGKLLRAGKWIEVNI